MKNFDLSSLYEPWACMGAYINIVIEQIPFLFYVHLNT